MFPQKFIYGPAVEEARERANILQNSSDRASILTSFQL